MFVPLSCPVTVAICPTLTAVVGSPEAAAQVFTQSDVRKKSCSGFSDAVSGGSRGMEGVCLFNSNS